MARATTETPIPATAQITDAAAAENVRQRIAEHRATLALLQGELAILEEQHTALLLARSLGEPFDARALLALTEQREALNVRTAEEATTVRALERLLSTWESAEQQRELVQVTAELQRIAAGAPALEEAYLAAADAYVAACAALLDAGREYQGHDATFRRLQRDLGAAPHGLRGPCRPFPISEGYTQPDRYRTLAPWEQHRDTMLRTRLDWRHRNPPAAEDPAAQPWWRRLASSPASQRFQVLRGRIVTTPEGRKEYPSGTFIDLPAQDAAWLERDSPGSLVPVEAA